MNCGICRVGGLRRTEVYFGCLWDKNTDAPDFRKCISVKVFHLDETGATPQELGKENGSLALNSYHHVSIIASSCLLVALIHFCI